MNGNMVAEGGLNEAVARWFSGARTPGEMLSLARKIATLDFADGYKTLNVAILGTSNVDFLGPALSVVAFADRILLRCWTAPFNQIDQEVIDPASALYRHKPSLALIFARAEDLIPALAHSAEFTAQEDIASWCEEMLARIRGWCGALTKAGIQVLLSSFVPPVRSPLGLRDFSHPRGQRAIWQKLNSMLADFVRETPGITVFDLEGVVRRVGAYNWEDPKLWYLAKIAGGTRHAALFAEEIMPVLREAVGRRRKVLVVDLDNTMWGGILGEDGLSGIKLGGDYPGNIFREVHKQLFELQKQGVILAINSKNNPSDVEEVFCRHPEMLVKLEHFATCKINWSDKAENLLAIAREINVSLDSLVFVDDNPAECARIRTALPEVEVLQVPANLVDYPRAVAEVARLFDGASSSEEDRRRTEMYKEDYRRQEMRDSAETVDDFLDSLAMVAEVSKVEKSNLARVVQLLHKTNQFNLTTRRHGEQFVVAIANDPSWLTYVVRLKDIFGDNGIVLVAFVRLEGASAVIETLLMSCRVINRTLEQTVMRLIGEDAAARGATELVGEYSPTAKNHLVKDFYPQAGFSELSRQDGLIRYRRLSADSSTDGLQHIKVVRMEH